MTIAVRQARLDTVQINVHALRVGHKQMTQAVFRQLLREHPLDHEKEELRGDLWGLVNYFWKGCHGGHREQLEHLHLVWQLGDELRRECIFSPRHCKEMEDEIRGIEHLLQEVTSLALFRRILTDPTSVKRGKHHEFEFGEWSCSTYPETAQAICRILMAIEEDPTSDWAKKQIAEARALIEKELRELEARLKDEPVKDEDQIALFCQKHLNKADSVGKNYGVFYQRVLELPQLFIAV
jgi:hypothetical protein